MSRIKIQNVRIAFPSLWQKAQFGGEATKFEATFLVDKSDTETVKRINAAINAKLLEKFKSKELKRKLSVVFVTEITSLTMDLKIIILSRLLTKYAHRLLIALRTP